MTHLARELSEEDSKPLRRYRRAAGHVHQRLLPYAAQQFKVSLGGDGRNEANHLIPEGDFIALLSSFRKVFATKEMMNFGRIANLTYRVGNPDIRRTVSQVREGWDEAFKLPIALDLHGESFTSRSILHTWINGEEFHQDESLENRAALLRSLGPLTNCILQIVVHRACFAVLGLDNVCGLLLGEPLRALPVVPAQDRARPG